MTVDRKALILEGTTKTSFFLGQILLNDKLIDRVDLVSRFDEAIEQLRVSDPYQLVVINLLEAPDEGDQLRAWLLAQPNRCPIIILAPQEAPRQPLELVNDSEIVILPSSISLAAFSQKARGVLAGMMAVP